MPSNWQDLDPFLRQVRDEVELYGFPRPIEDSYVFLNGAVRMHTDYTKWTVPAGRLIIIQSVPTFVRGLGEPGRAVILQADRNGLPEYGWLDEILVQKLLDEAAKSRHAQVNLTLELTNPKAMLLPGDPVCLLTKILTTEQSIPDFPEFTFEIAGPSIEHRVELMAANLLESGTWRPVVEFNRASKNELTSTVHAVLVFSDLNKEKTAPVPLVTERVGDYQIKIKERRSGSESPPVRFRVVQGTEEDQKAAALFASGAGVFLGQTDGLSVYKDLVQRYPNSRYAAYASFFVGRAKLEKLEASGKGRKNAAEIAVLEMYFDKTLTLGFPSTFELKALLYKARCLTAAGKVEARRKVLAELVSKYGDVAGVSGLDEAIREFMELDDVPALVVQLADPDIRIRVGAVERLKRLGPEAKPAVWALAQRLKDPDPKVGRLAAETLAGLGGGAESAVPALLEAFADEDRLVRFAADAALRDILRNSAATHAELANLLKNSDAALRRRAAWQLGQIRYDVAPVVPMLIAALDDNDAVVRGLAAHGIGLIGRYARAAIPAVVHAVQDPDRSVRRNAYYALAMTVDRRDAAVVPALVQALKDDDDDVRRYARSGLSAIGRNAKGAVPALWELVRSKDHTQHGLTAVTLGNIGAAAGDAAPALIECLRHEHSQMDHWNIAVALVRIDPAHFAVAAPRLIEFVQDTDKSARGRALNTVMQLGPQVAVPCLVEALRSKDAAVCADGADALGRIGPAAKPAVTALAQVLKHQSAEVRTAAAVAIMRVDRENAVAVPALAQLLTDRSEHVRHKAAAHFRELGAAASAAVPALIDALRDEQDWVSGEAALALRDIGADTEAAIHALNELMKAKRQYAPVCAAGALARLDPDNQAAIELLIGSLESRDAVVRPQAAQCLGELGVAAAPAVPALVKALKDLDVSVRREAARALGKIGPAADGGVPALTEALKDGSTNVRYHAAQSLGRIGTAAGPAVPALIEILRGGDWIVQPEAARALGAIGPAADVAVPALSDLTRTSMGDVRLATAVSLAELDRHNATAIEALIELLRNDRGDDIRQRAALALGKIGSLAPAAIPALTEAIEDEAEGVREAASEALRLIQSEQ